MALERACPSSGRHVMVTGGRGTSDRSLFDCCSTRPQVRNVEPSCTAMTRFATSSTTPISSWWWRNFACHAHPAGAARRDAVIHLAQRRRPRCAIDEDQSLSTNVHRPSCTPFCVELGVRDRFRLHLQVFTAPATTLEREFGPNPSRSTPTPRSPREDPPGAASEHFAPVINALRTAFGISHATASTSWSTPHAKAVSRRPITIHGVTNGASSSTSTTSLERWCWPRRAARSRGGAGDQRRRRRAQYQLRQVGET